MDSEEHRKLSTSCEYSVCYKHQSVGFTEGIESGINQVSWLGEGHLRDSLLYTECALTK